MHCITCHSANAQARAPVLEDLYGRTVHLRDGRTVVADDGYLRESILYPEAKIVQGWESIMPTFKGQVNEEELIRLIAFIKSLKRWRDARAHRGLPAAAGRPGDAARRQPQAAASSPNRSPRRKEQPAMSSAITTVFVPQRRRLRRATPEVNYLNVAYGVKSWLLTTDHKRIAILYLFTVTFMFFLGGAAATVIRLNLMTPTGELVTADTYNKLFTAHGIIMVFFFLVPVMPTVLGNFLVPMMIGASDLAFPKLNLLSWYLFIIGAVITLWAMLAGGVDTGWTFYTPFSTQSSAPTSSRRSSASSSPVSRRSSPG